MKSKYIIVLGFLIVLLSASTVEEIDCDDIPNPTKKKIVMENFLLQIKMRIINIVAILNQMKENYAKLILKKFMMK